MLTTERNIETVDRKLDLLLDNQKAILELMSRLTICLEKLSNDPKTK